MTHGEIVFLAAGFAFALGILGLVWWLGRPPKCPRCGAREWIALPHLGRYSACCRNCTKQVDFANWEKP